MRGGGKIGKNRGRIGLIGYIGPIRLAGFALGMILFFGIFAVKAYEPAPTHSELARKTAEIYNKFYNANFSQEEINWIQEGARNEDTPPRWINHFYDPQTGKGWTSERMGNLPANVVQTFSKLALSSEGAASAPQWAQDQILQVKYDSYQGNRTFQKAVFDYARGDKKEGLKSLGHILHLIEDMTVPAHTRQDTHYDAAGDPGEPYEKWAKNNTDLSHLSNLNPKQENFSCANVNDCFIRVAKYSNGNFFSEDTILNSGHALPRAVKISDEGFGYGIDGGILYKIIFKPGTKVIEKITVQDSQIHQSYWRLLSKEAVLGGAEIMRLFFAEAAKAKEDKSILETPPPKPISFLSNLYTGVNIVSSPSGYAVFSVFGEYEKLKNSAKQAISAAGNFFSGAADKVSSIFSSVAAPVSFEYSPQPEPQEQGLEQGLPLSEQQGQSLPAPTPTPNAAVTPAVIAPKEPAAQNAEPVKIVLAQDKPAATQTAPNATQEKSAITEINSPQNKAVPSPIVEKTSPAAANLIPSINSFVQGAAGPAPAISVSMNNTASAASNTSNNSAANTTTEAAAPAADAQADPILPADSTIADLIAPETTLTIFPAAISTSTAAIFEFTSSTASSTFVCQLDGATSTPCDSPKEYTNLSESEHNFKVKAKDGAGNEDATPAEYAWTIDSAAPEISGIQTAPTRDSAVISWIASGLGVFQIEYGATADYGLFSATTSLVNLTIGDLSPGAAYHFRISSRDSLGNEAASSDNVFTTSAQARNVVIGEIQISGGSASTTDEFVELYNPTDLAISLSGWKLARRTANATTSYSNLLSSFPDAAVIPALGYFLITHPTGYDGGVPADAVYSSAGYSLASNNTVILFSDQGETIVDMVGFGTAASNETQAADNPAANYSLERKAVATSTGVFLSAGGHKWLGNGYDVNDNSQDFVLQSKPSPQNSLMLTEPRASVPNLMADSNWPTWQKDQKRGGRIGTPAFASSSMAIKWVANGVDPDYSRPVLDRDDNIYIGTESGFAKVSPAGEKLWVFATSTSYGAAAIIEDGSIYFRGSRGLFAIDNNGRQKWKFPLGWGAGSNSAVAVLSDGALIFSSEGKIYAIDQDATLKWVFDPKHNLMASNNISAPIIDAKDNIYIGIDDYLYAISSDGALLWEKKLGVLGTSRSGITLGADNNLYVGARLTWPEARFYVIDAQTGDIKLDFSPAPSGFGNDRTYLAPVIDSAGNFIIPLAGAGYAELYSFRRNSSTTLWTSKINASLNNMAAPIITSDDKIYLAADSRVYIFDAADGKSLGFFDAGLDENKNKISIYSLFGAIGKDGTIYAASNKKLYAIGGAVAD